MPESFQLFKVSTLRRYGRIGLFLGRWVMRLLAASVEVYLRRNLGHRYLWMLFASSPFYLCCVGLSPQPGTLSALFLVGLFGLSIYHAVCVFSRPSRGVPEPHSFSPGDSWPIWQRSGLAQTTVQHWVEPAVCVLVGVLISGIDPFLGSWLIASGAALFIKQLLEQSNARKRILDALDAKLEAQKLNAGISFYQQRPGQGAARLHRAHLPRRGGHPHP